MNRIDRRSFLFATPLAVGVAMQTLSSCNLKRDASELIAANDKIGYGQLRPAKSRNTGETLLALPEGFEYTTIGRTRSKMSDGHSTPPGHDGMAAFDSGGQLRLVRNHEINNQIGSDGAAFGNAALAYDSKAGGGTTTLIIDPNTREIIKDFVSLNGTLQNCAGGPTPWGSWISCEETILGTNRVKDLMGRVRGGFTHSHGYCFEVSAKADGVISAQPLKAMGRFVHEAIAIDARTGIVYETEDANPAGFYRFIPKESGPKESGPKESGPKESGPKESGPKESGPKERGNLAAGGRLQMLAITGRHQFDLRTGQKRMESLPVHWVDIAEPDPPDSAIASKSVYQQGFAQSGATFARLEGCWYGGDSIFFTSTIGGDKRLGQVWQYIPQDNDRGALKLIFESPKEAVLNMPDNICVSPRGSLVICEDGDNHQYIRGMTREGQIFDFARNIVPGSEAEEFAGATFSPNGKTLFVNIQTPGITFAIWGPWQKGAL